MPSPSCQNRVSNLLHLITILEWLQKVACQMTFNFRLSGEFNNKRSKAAFFCIKRQGNNLLHHKNFSCNARTPDEFSLESAFNRIIWNMKQWNCARHCLLQISHSLLTQHLARIQPRSFGPEKTLRPTSKLSWLTAKHWTFRPKAELLMGTFYFTEIIEGGSEVNWANLILVCQAFLETEM